MKKSLRILPAVMLVLALSCTVFAEPSPYTKSPSLQEIPTISTIEIVPEEGESAPTIVVEKADEGEVQFYTKDDDGPAEDNCLVTLKVTPYVERETIETVVCKVTDGTSPTGEVSAEERLVYARTNTKNGTDTFGANNFALWRQILDDAAAEHAVGAEEAKAKIKGKDMAIVTIFDVSVWCEKPQQHDLGQHHCVHTLRLSFGDNEMISLLNQFVALMHLNRAGEWEYIPSRLFEDEETGDDVIEFSIDCDNLSPFAIAAYSSETGTDVPTSPQTGDVFPFLPLGCGLVLLAGVAMLAGKVSKKEQ